MEPIDIYATGLFYFAIASFFVLYCVINNESSSVSAYSKINSAFSKYLMLQSASIGVFALLNILRVNLSLSDVTYYRGLCAFVGFVMGFISFLCPYYLYILLKKHISGNHFLNSPAKKIYFVLMLSCTLVYVAVGGNAVYHFLQGKNISKHELTILLLMPACQTVIYLAAIPDLNRFLSDLVKDSFASRGVTVFVRLFFIIVPPLAILLGWYFSLPAFFMVMVAMVFIIQLVAQDRAVSIDFLTGLNNRKELIRYLNRIFEKGADLDHNLCIIFIDINDFKMVNDTYGHNLGDKVLLAVSDCLKKASFQSNCFICRYAGDEFTVVIKETSSNSAQQYVETFNEKLALCNESGLYPCKISASVGIVAYTEKYATPDMFIEAADKKMYDDKNVKKNSLF
ncbi:MAG: GGDEF domain-containing protein [Succinivibrio sp.]